MWYVVISKLEIMEQLTCATGGWLNSTCLSRACWMCLFLDPEDCLDVEHSSAAAESPGDAFELGNW